MGPSDAQRLKSLEDENRRPMVDAPETALAAPFSGHFDGLQA
jgi:hypothetical protein